MITDIGEFKRLCNSENSCDYRRITKDKILDKVCLEVIHDYPIWKEYLAENPNVSLNILRILSQDEDDRVRNFLAKNETIDYDLFKKLSLDEDECVRASIIGNRKTPLDILKKLAHHPFARTRIFAKKNYKSRLGLPNTLEGPAMGYMQWWGNEDESVYGIEQIKEFDLAAFISIFNYEKQAKKDPYMFDCDLFWLREHHLPLVQPYLSHKIDLVKHDYEFFTDEAVSSV